MANEANINIGISIRKNNLNYVPQPVTFLANVTNANGPSPGSVLAGVNPTLVSFSQLTTPALCRLTNLDTLNFVEYGVVEYPHAGTPATFYPVGEIQAGEVYLLRLSRNLVSFYLRANTAPVEVVVEGFSA